MTTSQRLFPIILSCFAAATSLFARSAGAPQGHSGAPGDNVCTACHRSNPDVNSGPGRVTVTFSDGSTYTPGVAKKVTVTITDPNGRRWGFQASPRLASSPNNTGAGQVTPSDGNTQVIGTDGTRQWITHTSEGTRNGTAGPVSFEFNWAPPSSNVGDVDFYVAANAANGNANNQGDFIYTTKATVNPAGATAQRPTIRENGVASAATSNAGVVAGSWVTIVGESFSSATRQWRDSDFVNGRLPTTLEGASVTINGKPAAISYVSPTQFNVQAPDDTATGNVAVVVKNGTGESTPRTVNLQAFSPAFFAFSPQQSKYAASVAPDGSYLGPPALFGADLTTRRARPGETILLFGTGFGPTNPAVPAGQLLSGAPPRLANDVRITIGGMAADVSFAGLSGVGLYQFNVVVPPAVPDGDQAVVATINGVQSPAGIFLAVGR